MDYSDIFKQIRRRNLEELAKLDLAKAKPLLRAPSGVNDDLVQWTKDSQAQIQAGVANRVFGGVTGSPIDFNNVFMAFMESASVGLRDAPGVIQAVHQYKKDEDRAHELYEESTKDIDKLADMWGMKFIVICDLIEKHPDGESFIVGPYCGAFVSKDVKNPFIGIAFKGTTVPGEKINDLLAVLSVQVPKDVLFGGQIASGFYFPLFSTYCGPQPSNEPFSLVKQAIQSISSLAGTTVITHVAGHSLGAAYATLCYAQLVIEGTGTTQAALGDLYAFGCPRVGRGNFVRPLEAAMAATPCGSAWRIVNDGDYVPKVPATLPWPWPLWDNPFIHIDAMYTIYNDAKPVPGPSEIGTHPGWTLPTFGKQHDTGEYYKSLTFATTGRLPSANDDLRMAVGAPGGVDHFKAAASHCVDQRLAESVKPQDFAVASAKCTFCINSVKQCARGTFQAGPLVGDITAWGDAIGIVPDSVTLHYNSLKRLCGVKTQCAVRASGPKEVDVTFVADGVVVAIAVVAMKSEVKEVRLDGTCVWELADTPLVRKLSEEWQKTTEAVFEKLFANV